MAISEVKKPTIEQLRLQGMAIDAAKQHSLDIIYNNAEAIFPLSEPTASSQIVTYPREEVIEKRYVLVQGLTNNLTVLEGLKAEVDGQMNTYSSPIIYRNGGLEIAPTEDHKEQAAHPDGIETSPKIAVENGHQEKNAASITRDLASSAAGGDLPSLLSRAATTADEPIADTPTPPLNHANKRIETPPAPKDVARPLNPKDRYIHTLLLEGKSPAEILAIAGNYFPRGFTVSELNQAISRIQDALGLQGKALRRQEGASPSGTTFTQDIKEVKPPKPPETASRFTELTHQQILDITATEEVPANFFSPLRLGLIGLLYKTTRNDLEKAISVEDAWKAVRSLDPTMTPFQVAKVFEIARAISFTLHDFKIRKVQGKPAYFMDVRSGVSFSDVQRPLIDATKVKLVIPKITGFSLETRERERQKFAAIKTPEGKFTKPQEVSEKELKTLMTLLNRKVASGVNLRNALNNADEEYTLEDVDNVLETLSEKLSIWGLGIKVEKQTVSLVPKEQAKLNPLQEDVLAQDEAILKANGPKQRRRKTLYT